MIEKPTYELDKLLENTGINDLSDYYKENSKYMADEKKAFYYYFKDVVDSKRLMLKDIYVLAGVSESWGSKIVSMEKHTKDRDLILRLCIAGHFTLEEINRALKLYGMSPLYSKDKRDASIIVAINRRVYDLIEINEILKEQDFPQLIITE